MIDDDIDEAIGSKIALQAHGERRLTKVSSIWAHVVSSNLMFPKIVQFSFLLLRISILEVVLMAVG